MSWTPPKITILKSRQKGKKMYESVCDKLSTEKDPKMRAALEATKRQLEDQTVRHAKLTE